MSGEAAKQSVINNVLPDLGLGSLDDVIQKLTLLDWIREGAIREDDSLSEAFARYRHHFLDPRLDAPNSGGFTGFTIFGFFSGLPAPDWALEPTPISSQIFSFKDARTYFLDALTKSTQVERDSNLALTFRTLGQVVHLVQDMAQPQHTRNDVHVFPPSLFERYTDNILGNLDFLSGSIPQFNRPRDFFTNDQGTGLAQYTNRSFVSQGTNFGWDGSAARSNSTYTFPLPLRDPEVASVQDLDVPPAIKDYCGFDSVCNMRFYSSINDRDEVQPRAATLSIFSDDLDQYNISPPNFDQSVRFSLNTLNFKAVLPKLIPRAVAYSAGMINYFFRGKIDLVPSPGNPAQFLIQNLGNEPMNGTFELYYDAVDGNRYRILDANSQPLRFQTNGNLTPGQNLPIAAFDSPTNPAPKQPLAYMLVFRGAMGAETVDAVAAKLVTARPGLGLYLLGVDASGNTVTMKADRKGLRVIRGLDANGMFVQNNQEFDPFQGGVPTNNPTGVVPQAHQLKQVAFQPSVTGDSYQVLSVAVGEATPFVVDSGFESPPVTALSYVLDSTQNRLLPQGFGASWLANSPLGTFTFSLTPNISFISPDGFIRIFFAADGALQYTVRLADGSISTGSVPLPPLGNLVFSAYAYTHGDYDGFRHGSLVVSGDGLTLSGLKPISPIDNGSFPGANWNISNSSLQIFPSIPPTVSLVSNDSGQVAFAPVLVFRNIVTPVPGPTSSGVVCSNLDRSIMPSGVLNAVESFYIGYINNGLSQYTRTVTNGGSFEELLLQCTVSLPTYTETTLRDARGRKGQFDYSFGLSFVDLSQTEVIGAQQTRNVNDGSFVGPGNPGQLTNTVSITNLVRVLTNEAKNAVTTVKSVSIDPASARLHFRGKDLGFAEFVADSSPLGEVFFATSDMGEIVHDPKPGRMPTITRGDIPANIVKLLAAIWL